MNEYGCSICGHPVLAEGLTCDECLDRFQNDPKFFVWICKVVTKMMAEHVADRHSGKSVN